MQDTVNGFDIIASAYVGTERLLILGEAYRNGRLSFVVSEMTNGAPWWHSGTYFDGPNAADNREMAKARYLARLSASWS